MNLVEAVDSVVRRYKDFSGRSSRSEFWYWSLATFVIYIFIEVLVYLVFSSTGGFLSWIPSMIRFVVFLIMTVLSLSVTCRRLHDTNRSGWLQLILYIPTCLFHVMDLFGALDVDDTAPMTIFDGLLTIIAVVFLIALIAFIVLWARDSDLTPNRYGDLPADKSKKNPFRTYVSAESPQVLGGRCVNSNCSAEIQPMFKFCIECGTDQTPKPKFCTSCGASVVGSFCGGCGAPQ